MSHKHGGDDIAIRKVSSRLGALTAQIADDAQIKQIGMIGVGSMGSMMSLLFAEHRSEVYFFDLSECRIARYGLFTDNMLLGEENVKQLEDLAKDCSHEK